MVISIFWTGMMTFGAVLCPCGTRDRRGSEVPSGQRTVGTRRYTAFNYWKWQWRRWCIGVSKTHRNKKRET